MFHYHMIVKHQSANDMHANTANGMHANTMWQVEALDPREIAAFTADAGYKTSFIPAGMAF
jgi:alpha-L-fucosidase